MPTRYCVEITKMFKAGGSAAMITPVKIQMSGKLPIADSNTQTSSGCSTSLIATSTGTSTGNAFIGRSATVTPSRNSAQGAAAWASHSVILSSTEGSSKWVAAASTPSSVATLKGWVATCQITRRAVSSGLFFSTPASAIRKGMIENSKRLSKTKISTSGALAASPSAASSKGGPI